MCLRHLNPRRGFGSRPRVFTHRSYSGYQCFYSVKNLICFTIKGFLFGRGGSLREGGDLFMYYLFILVRNSSRTITKSWRHPPGHKTSQIWTWLSSGAVPEKNDDLWHLTVWDYVRFSFMGQHERHDPGFSSRTLCCSHDQHHICFICQQVKCCGSFLNKACQLYTDVKVSKDWSYSL